MGTRVLISTPLDDFVLTPKSRIAFDLLANINPVPTAESLWNIILPNGEYSVKYLYHVDRDTDWRLSCKAISVCMELHRFGEGLENRTQ